AKLNWAVTDAEGNALPDGTKVNITATAIPSYYVKNEDKPLGKGISYTIPVTVDNTKPSAELKEFTETVKDVSGNVTEPGKITLAVTDNRYVAAVAILAADKKTVLNGFAVNQTELGATTEISFEYPQRLFYILVVDYAGNTQRYRVNASGEPDATIADSIELSAEHLTMVKGGTAKLEATVGPETIIDDSVTWVSLDESVVTIDENGVLTAVGEGRAIVGALTNVPGADGEPLAAACVVDVITIEADLNTTLWDEEGGVYFGSFNSADLTLKKISAKQAAPFLSAVVIDGTLYSGTAEGELYKVNPNTFESEFVGELAAVNTDFAYGVGNGKLYGTYSKYLLIQDLEGNLEDAYDLTRYTEGNYVSGIAYLGSVYNRNYGCYIDVCYVIDEAGIVYNLLIVGNLGIVCQPIGESGISTNGEWKYSSLYYDADTGFIFYSCYDGTDDVSFYAIADYYNSQTDEEWIEAYRLGQFTTKVWPVSGLYQWASENAAVPESVTKLLDTVPALNTDKLTSVEKIDFNSKKTPVLAEDKEETTEEAPAEEAEDVSDNDAAPAEDVSENEASEEAPAEDAAPAEEAPAEEEPVEAPAPDTSANDD
ncbi:MAG: Ig-like domain-containing protein, partial [Lachnospiraceae bacterium]|nr:Ig-like domain-containing protein [Lachnospiraceae bacterium]